MSIYDFIGYYVLGFYMPGRIQAGLVVAVVSFGVFVGFPLQAQTAHAQNAPEISLTTSQTTSADLPTNLSAPYLPTRAVVPTKPQIATLGHEAYKLGAYHDSIRWYKHLRPTNKMLADFGIARSFERLGRYQDALTLLNKQRHKQSSTHPKTTLSNINKLRGHVLLRLTEQAQLRSNLDKSEDYLRRFFSDHRRMRQNTRYTYLMRQQSLLATQRQKHDAQQPLHVGLLLPLSDYMGAVGNSMEKAALLALYQQNLPNLKIYPQDTQGTPGGTQKAFERAQQDNVDVVLGPLLGNNVKAIASHAKRANIPLISFSSDTNAILNNHVRLFSLLPANQAKRMARYAVDAKGLRTFSALLPDNRYGRTMLKAFKTELERLGARLDRHAFFKPGTPDLKTPLRHLTRMAQSEKKIADELSKLQETHALLASAMDDADLARLQALEQAEAQPDVRYQALFVPASGDAMPLISSQLAFYDSDGSQIQLLGSAQWQSADLLKNSSNYLHNSIYPATPAKKEAQFKKKFAGVYQQNPHTLAKLVFDSINLIGHLSRQGWHQGTQLEQYLNKLKAFHGATGPYQILPNGTLKHGYRLVQIQRNNTTKEISTPPDLLPPKNQPIQNISNVSNRSHTPRKKTKSRSFFGGLFGN